MFRRKWSSRLRTILCGMTLQFAAMFGLVIPLEELERLLRNMSAQEVAHTLPDEDADGKNKKF